MLHPLCMKLSCDAKKLRRSHPCPSQLVSSSCKWVSMSLLRGSCIGHRPLVLPPESHVAGVAHPRSTPLGVPRPTRLRGIAWVPVLLFCCFFGQVVHVAFLARLCTCACTTTYACVLWSPSRSTARPVRGTHNVFNVSRLIILHMRMHTVIKLPPGPQY
jgi:hypothetical protein